MDSMVLAEIPTTLEAYMNIYMLSNDAVWCYVVAKSVEDAREAATEYFGDDDAPVTVKPMKYDSQITIRFQGSAPIAHTVKDWLNIYYGVTREAFIMSQSEY